MVAAPTSRIKYNNPREIPPRNCSQPERDAVDLAIEYQLFSNAILDLR